MSEKRVTFQYSFGEFCVFFQWVLFCANQLKGREKSSSAFSLQLEQSMPLCSVGGRRQIDGLRNRKWGVQYSYFLPSGEPAVTPAPEHSIPQLNLLTKQKQSRKCRKQTCGYEEREVGRDTWRLGLTRTYY